MIPLLLFIRRKLGTSKIDCGDKTLKKPCFFYILKREIEYLLQGLWQLDGSCFDRFLKLEWNGSASLCYVLLISVQKLTYVIKSSITDSLRIHREREREREQKNRPTSYREYWLKTARINWDKDGIDQKEFPYNSEELWNVISPYS